MTSESESKQLVPYRADGDTILLSVPVSPEDAIASIAVGLVAAALLLASFFACAVVLVASLSLLFNKGVLVASMVLVMAAALGGSVLSVAAVVSRGMWLGGFGRYSVHGRRVKGRVWTRTRNAKRVSLHGEPGERIRFRVEGRSWFDVEPKLRRQRRWDWLLVDVDAVKTMLAERGFEVEDERDLAEWHAWATDPAARSGFELKARGRKSRREFASVFKGDAIRLPHEVTLDGIRVPTPLWANGIRLFGEKLVLNVDTTHLRMGRVDVLLCDITACEVIVRAGDDHQSVALVITVGDKTLTLGSSQFGFWKSKRVVRECVGLQQLILSSMKTARRPIGTSEDIPTSLKQMVNVDVKG